MSLLASSAAAAYNNSDNLAICSKIKSGTGAVSKVLNGDFFADQTVDFILKLLQYDNSKFQKIGVQATEFVASSTLTLIRVQLIDKSVKDQIHQYNVVIAKKVADGTCSYFAFADSPFLSLGKAAGEFALAKTINSLTDKAYDSSMEKVGEYLSEHVADLKGSLSRKIFDTFTRSIVKMPFQFLYLKAMSIIVSEVSNRLFDEDKSEEIKFYLTLGWAIPASLVALKIGRDLYSERNRVKSICEAIKKNTVTPALEKVAKNALFSKLPKTAKTLALQSVESALDAEIRRLVIARIK